MTTEAIAARRAPPTNFVPLEMPIEHYSGQEMTRSADGGVTPIRTIKPRHKLEDQTVRRIIAFAMEISAQVARFRLHAMDDVVEFQNILADEFGAKRGGAKGNVTLKSFDDCLKVEVKTATLITYGAEIQRAKELFDEFVKESSDGASAELLALVTGAFQVDAEGKINRAKLVQLKRLSIDHPLWTAAMEALNEAERPGASRSYLRFWWRPNVEAAWQSITVDVAAQ
ncbi:DUF3164 family protein [Methylopila sp. M107]|uniref:DUF3164 family protein n=1 Tax=Methylopila sp. M107 TaxID=1101190 RepID=UPI00035DC422|nr:DUF3164 family protein [Methylopila sp. M107]